MKRHIFVGAMVFSLIMGTSVLVATQTGSVSGIVRTYEGQPISEAVVKISGDLMPGGKELVTRSDGRFRFLYLPPGQYKLVVSHPKMMEMTLEIRVALEKDTQVEVIMFEALETEIQVTAVAPLLDLKSNEISVNWLSDTIEKLPVGRSFSSLFQLAPGVADNLSFGPHAGGNRQDNVYLYDGANITNPHFGYLGADFNQNDIEEVDFKRGGISAEFGRAIGMVVNAITKSGSNEIRGNLRVIVDPKALTYDSKDPALKRKNDTMNYAFGLGGPFVKDRLWWYASANYRRDVTSDRQNNLGVVPDAKANLFEGFIKLTFQPYPRHRIALSYRNQTAKNSNQYIGENDHPSTGADVKVGNSILLGDWNWQISHKSYFSFKAIWVKEANKIVPTKELGYDIPFNYLDPSQSGNFETAPGFILGGANQPGQYVGAYPFTDTTKYRRYEIKATFTQFLDFSGHSHLIKAGLGFEEGGENVDLVANGWGEIWYDSEGNELIARRWLKPSNQDAMGRTYSFFVQDSITVQDRLTLNLGLLMNRDEFSSKVSGQKERKKFLTFDFNKEIQPRLGFSFVVDKKTADKIYGSYGRYYNMDNKSISRSSAPNRIGRTYYGFDPVTGSLNWQWVAGNETGKVIAKDIRPTHTDEFQLGYSRPIINKWVADVWYQYRHTTDIIEDFAQIKYPDPDDWIYDNYPGAFRKYSAINFQLEKKAARDKWSFTASYTYSKMWGNWDIDYSGEAVYYQSSWVGDGPGLYPEEPNRTGRLYGDRPHVVKIFSTWQLLHNTIVGAYFRAQSGHAWQALERCYWGPYLAYHEPAGSRRTPTWYNLDLQLQHILSLYGKYRMTLELRAMNLFNNQTVLEYDARYDMPTFLKPISYAEPGRFIFTVHVNF